MALLMLAAALFAIAVTSFYLYHTWNHKYWERRNVPYDPPSFFVGSLRGVLTGTKHFGLVYASMYRKFKHLPYVGFFKLRNPAVLVNDPELVKCVLVKDFACFAKNDFEIDRDVDPILSENIFAQIGDEWKKNRAAWTTGLTMSKIKATHEVMATKCDLMIEHLKRRAESAARDEPIDARELSSSFFTDVVVTSIFGLDINSFETKSNRYRTIVNSFFQPSLWEGLKLLSFMLTPGLARVLKLRFVSKSIEDELMVVANDIVDSRKTTNYHKNNSFDSILCNENKYDKISKYTIAGLVFNFLVDGTETSAGVSGFLLYLLAANPHVQNKLREELLDAPKEDNGKISFDTINKLPYLDMIFSETLRLYPPALTIHRVCTKSFRFPPINPGDNNGGFEMEPGTAVVIPVYAMHMNPEYFPDPERFDPERFSEANRNNFPKFAYLPFGEGPRVCIGSRFGANQVKVGVAGIISNFEVKLAPVMRNRKIEIDPNILLYRNIGGLWITLNKLR